MKDNANYIGLQIARFGAVNVQQLLKLCSGKCGQSSIYRSIRKLMDSGCVKRISHPGKAIVGFTASPDLYELVYGKGHTRATGTPVHHLEHSIVRADALI